MTEAALVLAHPPFPKPWPGGFHIPAFAIRSRSMKTLALGLSITVLAGCGAALAEQAAQPGRGPRGASITRAQAQDIAGRMFERMDFNHDGKLDASDGEARHTAMKTAMFDRMDANRDGQISRDE